MPSPPAVLRLLRPANLVITAAGVAVGAVLSHGGVRLPEELLPPLVVACLSAVLVAAGGNVLNDLMDVDVDAVNRPNRPLPSGQISATSARSLWIGLSLAGVLAAGLVSWLHAATAAAAALLLWVYSTHLKGIVAAGNVAVAVLVAFTLVYGGWVIGAASGALVGAAFAFLTTFAREVIKDIQDVEGDRAAGAQTIPLAWGVPAARRVANGAIGATVVLTPVPYLAMDYGRLFLLLVLAADLMLLRCIWLAPSDPRQAARASAWLKTGMLVGIAALFAA